MTSTVSVLTGGGDRPYALGLAQSLADAGISLDFISSDFLESEELRANPRVHVLNLRGSMNVDAPIFSRIGRVLRYYVRLIRYAYSAEPRIFHILWNNKFELIDRTILLWYYRLCGHPIVMTVHNVNARMRDGQDSALNRATLRIQYHGCDHLFVHTAEMKRDLIDNFAVSAEAISVIPFGINSTVPDTDMTHVEARARLGLRTDEQVLLFFGNIAPYKGVEYLVEAMELLESHLPRLRVIIAGRPKGSESYWRSLDDRIERSGLGPRVIRYIEYVPDAETEIYFKAADVLILPYTQIFQSGVLFLAYNFGLPVIAADIASMKDDIVDGETGYVFEPKSGEDLARKIDAYFASPLYATLGEARPRIQQYAAEKYSWAKVAAISKSVYTAVRSSTRQ
jgi:glycosyltransferase involved in cell wall biosynthesis